MRDKEERFGDPVSHRKTRDQETTNGRKNQPVLTRLSSLSTQVYSCVTRNVCQDTNKEAFHFHVLKVGYQKKDHYKFYEILRAITAFALIRPSPCPSLSLIPDQQQQQQLAILDSQVIRSST